MEPEKPIHLPLVKKQMIKQVRQKQIEIGNYSCLLNLTDKDLTVRLNSKSKSLAFNWVLTKQKFKQNKTLVFLLDSLPNFVNFIIAQSSNVNIDQQGNIQVKICIKMGSQHQKFQTFEFTAKPIPLTQYESLKMENDRLIKQNKKVSHFQQIQNYLLPSQRRQNQFNLTFTPNTLQQSYHDFQITKSSKLKVVKTKRNKEYSRLSNNKPISRYKKGKYFYSCTISNINCLPQQGQSYIGLYAKQLNKTDNYQKMSIPNNQSEVPESVYFTALSLATFKVKTFINQKITFQVVNQDLREMSPVSFFPANNIEIQMQIDTELGLISWFVEQQYIGSAIIENKSAQKWFATIYFCNTSQTVIFY